MEERQTNYTTMEGHFLPSKGEIYDKIVNKNVELLDTLTYSLLLGGVAGNLIDRIIHGDVIDYIGLKIFGYNFPIFNFADICIVLSVILIFASMIKGDLWKD